MDHNTVITIAGIGFMLIGATILACGIVLLMVR